MQKEVAVGPGAIASERLPFLRKRLSGFVAPQSKIHEGYSPSSRLAIQPFAQKHRAFKFSNSFLGFAANLRFEFGVGFGHFSEGAGEVGKARGGNDDRALAAGMFGDGQKLAADIFFQSNRVEFPIGIELCVFEGFRLQLGWLRRPIGGKSRLVVVEPNFYSISDSNCLEE